MESRVLSRACNFASLSQLRKPPRENNNNNNSVSFVSARPIGAVGEGGNLIWGRQLRPALLLENSSAGKQRETVKPCLAAASSSPGSDSAGWGPFPSVRSDLVVGFRITRSPLSVSLDTNGFSLSLSLWLLRRCCCYYREAKPVGLIQKYPALVTGFFFFMWYVPSLKLDKDYFLFWEIYIFKYIFTLFF